MYPFLSFERAFSYQHPITIYTSGQGIHPRVSSPSSLHSCWFGLAAAWPHTQVVLNCSIWAANVPYSRSSSCSWVLIKHRDKGTFLRRWRRINGFLFACQPAVDEGVGGLGSQRRGLNRKENKQ